jgi:nitrite reductase/ring-hydroxylating ferredoxin subunit
MMKKIFIYIFGLTMMAGCDPDLSDDSIPWQPFDVITMNLNLPEYIKLRSDGTFMYLNDKGVRGIIVYHKNGSEYVAYERNCSFQPNSACATVEVHVSTLYILCPCCSSTFDLATGNPTAGVAWRPLRQYETSFDGSTLTITDQVIE